MSEGLVLANTQISTFEAQNLLTRATGFFFTRSGRLFLVTSRHVVLDEPAKLFADASKSTSTPPTGEADGLGDILDSAPSRCQERVAPARSTSR